MCGNVHGGDVLSVQRENVHGLDVYGEDIQCGNVRQCAAMYTGVVCSMCRERIFIAAMCTALPPYLPRIGFALH